MRFLFGYFALFLLFSLSSHSFLAAQTHNAYSYLDTITDLLPEDVLPPPSPVAPPPDHKHIIDHLPTHTTATATGGATTAAAAAALSATGATAAETAAVTTSSSSATASTDLSSSSSSSSTSTPPSSSSSSSVPSRTRTRVNIKINSGTSPTHRHQPPPARKQYGGYGSGTQPLRAPADVVLPPFLAHLQQQQHDALQQRTEDQLMQQRVQQDIQTITQKNRLITAQDVEKIFQQYAAAHQALDGDKETLRHMNTLPVDDDEEEEKKQSHQPSTANTNNNAGHHSPATTETSMEQPSSDMTTSSETAAATATAATASAPTGTSSSESVSLSSSFDAASMAEMIQPIDPIDPVVDNAVTDAQIEPWLELANRCFHHTTSQYTYTFCPYKNVTQTILATTHLPTHTPIALGIWGEWQEDIQTGAVSMLFNDGTACGSGKKRQAKVTFECGPFGSRLGEASEPEVCSYAFTFYTQLVCTNEQIQEATSQCLEPRPQDDRLIKDLRRCLESMYSLYRGTSDVWSSQMVCGKLLTIEAVPPPPPCPECPTCPTCPEIPASTLSLEEASRLKQEEIARQNALWFAKMAQGDTPTPAPTPTEESTQPVDQAATTTPPRVHQEL